MEKIFHQIYENIYSTVLKLSLFLYLTGNKEGSAISCSSSDKAKKFRLEISVVKEYKQKVLAQLTAEIGVSKVMKKGDG